MHVEKRDQKIVVQDLRNKVENLEKTKADLLDQIAQWQNQFQYYQSIGINIAKELDLLQPATSMKFIEDLSPLQQQEKLQRVRNVEKHRTKMDLAQQEEIIQTLEEQLKLNEVTHDLTKDYKVFSQAIRGVY